jgi:hypothetical protein
MELPDARMRSALTARSSGLTAFTTRTTPAPSSPLAAFGTSEPRDGQPPLLPNASDCS